MMKYIEFKDYTNLEGRENHLSAVEQLNEFKQKYPSARVVGYNTQVFENANNRERSYILVKYYEE